VRLQADGTFSPEVWINDNPLDMHISWEAAVAAGVVSLGLLSVGLEGPTEIIGTRFNALLVQCSREFVAGVMGQAPAIIATILGGAFSYRSLGLDGEDIVFDYIAPLEPDPKLEPNYLGVMGPNAFQEGPHI
jgi:hypothetical protein